MDIDGISVKLKKGLRKLRKRTRPIRQKCWPSHRRFQLRDDFHALVIIKTGILVNFI